MNDLIPQDVIARMTGYSQGEKQCDCLDKHGIFYMRDRSGNPHTTWYHFNNPHHLRVNDPQAHKDDEPNFGSLTNGQKKKKRA